MANAISSAVIQLNDKNRMQTSRERLRNEIEQQICEYLSQGGAIESLPAPSYQPHRAVNVSGMPSGE